MEINQPVLHQTPQSGFSLLEVLISLVILAVGLLGLAGLQATGLKQNHSAYMRSQATQLTYDIADRMRSNKVALASYIIANSNTALSINTPCVTPVGCNATSMAGRDLYEWNLAISNVLPSGIGTIATSDSSYTITVNWDDNRSGATDADDPSFALSFQP
jgi:type IV pilus assembly protein PilV